MDRITKAAELFEGGYNCAQAVAAAFADELGLEEKQAAKMVSGFGGGIGRLREVCGAVSGMVFVLSSLYGYDSPDQERQMHTYAMIQAQAEKFRQEAGSIICRELLEKPPSDPKPTPRTPEFYSTRPCTRLVILAASLVEAYIREHPMA